MLKRAKIEKNALCEVFGENGEFQLKTGLLYDPKRWSDKDF